MKPKHRQIFDALSRDIASGRYASGQKLPSEAALVKRFHVSRITVGRAVSDLRERGLVERFAGSGTYVKGPSTEPGNSSVSVVVHSGGFNQLLRRVSSSFAAAAIGNCWTWLGCGKGNVSKQVVGV